MPEKRMSTRFRGEPPSKKRALTPPARAPSPPPAPPKVIEIQDERLPVKIAEDQPLPTLIKAQKPKLPQEIFQSISESGVLSASIGRSRQKWTNEGVFERYWEKPSKKKPLAGKSNPAKETMSRLGACTMIIEPHTFDVTLYTVKDLQTAPKPPPQPQPQPQLYQPLPPSHYRPFPQPSPYQPPFYGGPFMGTHDSNGVQPSFPASQNTLPPFGEGFGRIGTSGAQPPYRPPPPPERQPEQPARPPLMPRKSSGSTNNNSQIPLAPKDPQSDPVIQILATRAASDHTLKSLMKIVASGHASKEQLKEFQNHIDEINSSLPDRKTSSSEVKKKEPLGPSVIHYEPPAPSARNASMNRPIPSIETHPPPPSSHTDPASVPIKMEPIHTHYYPPMPQPLRLPARPPPAVKPEIHSVVFDFGGSGDRFSFPRYSILDYILGGTEVIVSFLLIRRGSTTRAPRYKESKNYYQPVTMRLSSQNPRTLEPLSRIVAPPDEVRKHMDGIFDKMLPAEQVHLATRLPREEDYESDEGNVEEKEVEKDDPVVKTVAVKSLYEAPNSLVPIAA